MKYQYQLANESNVENDGNGGEESLKVCGVTS
jgi:hypothetical protein